MNTNNNVQDEIIEALKMNPEDIHYQDSLPPEESPLSYPVAEKHFEDPPRQEEPAKEVDNGHAMMMADVILGAANNIIEVGGGFFIKIKTDASFLEYEELVQVIDEQNQRNIKRLILDEGDKAMLRPLLAQVLKARQKVLSPEHQLLIAGVSILIKKAQLVMEVRAENQILTERILNIIQQESQPKPEPMPYQNPFQESKQEEIAREAEIETERPFSDQVQESKQEEITREAEMETQNVSSDQEGTESVTEMQGKTETMDQDLKPESEPKLSRQERRREERKARKADVSLQNGKPDSSNQKERTEHEDQT